MACARIRLEGGDPPVSDGFRAAKETLERIVVWALVSATVGPNGFAASAFAPKDGKKIAALSST